MIEMDVLHNDSRRLQRVYAGEAKTGIGS